MKITCGIIAEATESELFDYWLNRGYCDIYSFPRFLLMLHRNGTKITGKERPGDGRQTDPEKTWTE